MSYKKGSGKKSKLIWFDEEDFKRIEACAKIVGISTNKYILLQLGCTKVKAPVTLGEEWLENHRHIKKEPVNGLISSDPYRV